MTGNATNSSKGRMDCERVAREEIAESYLGGRLNEEDRDAFEAHYFECARCFDELQILNAVRAELQRTGVQFGVANTARQSFRWAAVAGLAAAVVLAIGAVLWMGQPMPSGPNETTTQTQPPSRTEEPAKPQLQSPAPTVASEPSLQQLARLDPPQYEPLTLRGAPDEATARFQRGMEQYRKTDYEGAITDLLSAAELDPDGAHIRFFLGISHLLLGQDNAAIDQLRATIALGDSAYLEEAHLYLAKAFLRRRDIGAAETQLSTLIQLRGSGSGEARRLLTQLQRLKGR